MKINLLDQSVYTKIAAGEVVERPASVIKELLENAIDAGATNIVVEVLGGGITSMKVTDNGCGMEFDDLARAFMPHATSKIATVEDLATIGTLGFRGEALSSIASVSKVTATTKTPESEMGSKIEIDGGKVVSHIQAGCPNGTTVTIENLFYNIPARAKFLKKPKQEESEITNIVSRIILSHPQLSFKYSADNRLVFLTQGTNLLDAIYTIYGRPARDNVLPVKVVRDVFELSGYIGNTAYTKPNRTYQTLLINGRYVVNQTISTAVYKAYEGFLMKGNFPFYVLNLTLPLDKIDVNVHPNKLDVKFEENNRIFGFFLTAIAGVLFDHTQVKNLDTAPISMPRAENLQKVLPSEGSMFTPLNNQTQQDLTQPDENYVKLYEEKRNSLQFFLNDPKEGFVAKQDNGFANSLIEQAILTESKSNFVNETMFQSDAYKIVGVLWQTFILVQQGENAYFIDQHAAHERLLYDQFKEQFETKTMSVQDLLVPYILDVNYMESDFILNNLDAFTACGFDLVPFGANTFKVNAVPVLLKDISLHAFFETVLSDLQQPKLKIKPTDIMESYLARSACRSAVKANDILSEQEIDILLQQLNITGQILLCPHGRPVVVKVNKTDLEKWFKRIV